MKRMNNIHTGYTGYDKYYYTYIFMYIVYK